MYIIFNLFIVLHSALFHVIMFEFHQHQHCESSFSSHRIPAVGVIIQCLAINGGLQVQHRSMSETTDKRHFLTINR